MEHIVWMVVVNLQTEEEYTSLLEIYKQFKITVAREENCDPQCVLPTNGATGALGAVFGATAVQVYAQGGIPHAVVAIPEYFDAIRMLSTYKYTLNKKCNKEYKYPLEEVVKSLSEDPSVIYLSVPHNPTGNVLRKQDLEYLLAAVGKKTRVVIDKSLIHQSSYCNTQDIMMMAGEKDVVIINSFSKKQGYILERVGYIIAKEETIKTIHPYSHLPSGASLQKAIEGYGHKEYIATVIRKIQHSNQLLNKWKSAEAKYYPSESNFSVIGLSRISGESCRIALEAKGFLVKSGKQLESDDTFIRIVMDYPQAIPKLLEALDAVLSEATV